MKIRAEFKVRDIAGEHVVIMQGRYGADMTKVITLNDSSLWLWEQLFGKEFSSEDAAQLLIEHYGIDRLRATKDAEIWTEKLCECNLVEKNNED